MKSNLAMLGFPAVLVVAAIVSVELLTSGKTASGNVGTFPMFKI